MHPIGPHLVGNPGLPAPLESKEKHFEAVYNQNYRKVYQICRRYSSKPEEAKDLTHDVFVRYFQNFDKFRHEASPSTWMYRVAINLGIQRWRTDRTRVLEDKELETLPADTHQDLESMLLDRIALAKVLDRCPERTRKILSLFHVERRTQIEIGELMGISRATVTRHLVYFKRFRQRQGKPEAGFGKAASDADSARRRWLAGRTALRMVPLQSRAA